MIKPILVHMRPTQLHLRQSIAAPATGRHARCSGRQLQPPPHESASLAALVPDFPRFGKTIRDFIAQDLAQAEGGAVTGDTVNSLLIPDIVQPSSLYTAALILCCVVVFVYWEGGQLLEGFQAEKELEQLEDKYREDQQQTGGGGGSAAAAAARRRRAGLAAVEAVKRERRRGLAWLALATALALWCAGGLTSIVAPF
jgi:hypothetical protein